MQGRHTLRDARAVPLQRTPRRGELMFGRPPASNCSTTIRVTPHRPAAAALGVGGLNSFRHALQGSRYAAVSHHRIGGHCKDALNRET